MTRKVERVVVVGRDAALWLTAIGLHRALSRTGVSVRAVELASQVRPADVCLGMPTLKGLHQLLGIDERELLKACGGTYVLAQRFSGWSASAPDFVHAYDTQGASFNNVDFLHYWVKARAEGMRVALEDFSLGAAAAKFGRFVVHSQDTETFSKATYGYQLDATAYVAFTKRWALRHGIEVSAGELADVEVADGRIASVTLDGGEPVEGDLFIDASGADAALMSAMPDAPFESWGAWLGCDRMLAASGERLNPLPAFSEIKAFAAGWVGLYPLQHRTAVVAMFDSARMTDLEVRDLLTTLTGLHIDGAVARPFAAGARTKAWSGNCVAIGQAAVSLDQLDAAPLHLIHTGLSHLVTFFPVNADEMPEAGPYNAAMSAHARNLRDFQIAHFKLNGRVGEPFWDAARVAAGPETLDYKIALFGARGRVALYDDETFQDENWTSVFVGHGLIPRAYDPLAERMPREEQIQQFQHMLRFIAGETRDMPSLEAHMDLSPPRQGGAMF
jgi:tryptophan 7-halogenase